MFLTENARAALEDNGVRLPPGRTPKLKAKARTVVPLMLELQAVPLVDLSPDGLENPNAVPCALCGRLTSGFRDFLMREEATLPNGVDLCRARNNAAVYLVSERFVDIAAALKLTGYITQRLTMSGASVA